MVRLVLQLLIAAAIVPMFFPVSAYAHPHVWVTVRSELIMKDKTVTAVRHHWLFDEAFSAFASQGLDENGDGTLSREELQPLAQVNVESLSEYAYFSDLYEQGAPDTGEEIFDEPRDYWLSWQGPQLELHFTLPLLKPVPVGQEVLLDVYDPTFFVDFSFAKTDPAHLVDAQQGCAVKIKPAGTLDEQTLGLLAEIPADQREIPDDLMQMTSTLTNQVILTCE